MVTVNGKPQKQGGNVVSYFCTPQGQVIHFVLGPASPKQLLAEAEWAVSRHAQAGKSAESDLTRLAAAMRRAHQERKDGDRKAHRFLAERPLPYLSEVYLTVFKDLLNQEVSQAGPYLAQASRGFQKARELKRPVVLFLYKGDGPDAVLLYRQFLAQPVVTEALERCVFLTLPLEELPALSALLDIPAYRVPSKANPAIVIAEPSGTQLDAVAGLQQPHELAQRIGLALEQLRARSSMAETAAQR